MYETVVSSLAERIQNLGRSPEGEYGLLPLFGTPLTDVCMPLQLIRDLKKFMGRRREDLEGFGQRTFDDECPCLG